jgi:FKBP12-rapamycin complex-associated protein
MVDGLKSDLFFPSYVLNCLRKILTDPSLSDYHTQTFQAMVYTLKTLGSNAAKMLDGPMQIMLQVMTSSSMTLATKELYLQEMATLISATGIHMRKYLKEFVEFWKVCWECEPTPPYIPALLFMESIAEVMHAEMGPYGHMIAARLMRYIKKQVGNMNYAVQLALSVLKNMTPLLEPFLDDIAAVLKEIESQDGAPKSLLRIVSQVQEELDSFFSIDKRCEKRREEEDDNEFDEVSSFESIETSTDRTVELTASYSLKTNVDSLREAWKYRGRDRTDWTEWLRQLCLEFIRESPTPSIRTCSSLSSSYVPLQRKLFNVAFASIWLQLEILERNDFLKNLELVLGSSDIPHELIQVFLDLVEFMDHGVSAEH